MKKVGFKIENPLILEYDRNEVRNFLRDKFAQYLVKYSLKKLDSGECKNSSEAISYAIKIFSEILKLELPSKELRQMEYLHIKFSFLQEYKTQIDEIIHMATYKFIALCSGDKKEAESMVCNLGVTDKEGRKLDFRNGLDWEHSKALRQDIASLTKECVKVFLQELQETGRIMTSAELAEAHKAEIDSSTDDSFSSTDHDVEKTTGRNSDSSTSSGSTTITQDSNNSNAQQRGALLPRSNDEFGEEKNTNNSIESESESKSELSGTILNFLAWIYELPEWLQEKMLNSAPVKALLEKAKTMEAIYNQNNYLLKQLTNLFAHDKSTSLNDITEDKQSSKVTLTNLESENSIELVDTTMILENSQITGLILPMAAVESGAIFPDNGFDGLLHFNGLNALDIF